MIYLRRNTEIAVLEDSSRLAEYEARGCYAVPYAAYREAWRRKSTTAYEHLRAVVGERMTPIPDDARRHIPAPCCPALAFRQWDGSYKCSSCKRIVKER